MNKAGNVRRPRRFEEDRLLAAKVAYLRSKGAKQSDIADRLRLTRPTVSRLLAAGGKCEPYLKVQLPTFDWSRVSSEDRKHLVRLDNADRSPELAERLSAIAPHDVWFEAHIVQGPAEYKTPEGWTHADSFHANAARLIWTFLRPAEVIGVTWGKMLSQLLGAARHARFASPFEGLRKQPMVIPLCGEPLGAGRPSSMSSSTLAQGFGEILTNCPQEKYLSLGMVPVFFPGPEAFKDLHLEAARELISYSAAYRKIFDKENNDGGALAMRLDVVLTSISRRNRPYGFGDSSAWKTLKLSELEKLLLGDLGGVPLAKPDLTPAKAELLAEYLKRWTGLERDHLMECVRRASKTRRTAGVVVVAKAAEQADTVLEAVRLGLVNRLIVTRTLGKELLDRLAAQEVPH
jgi:DNA-binding transcriptional regulator LsrR (DeoR family)